MSRKIGRTTMVPPTTASIPVARRLRGRLKVPGDKSISHRYALLAAQADGRSEIQGYSPGADCRSTLACLRRLGVDAAEDTHTAVILGRGLRGLRSPGGPLDAGNSGTTMRLLAGVVAGHPFPTTLVGDASLSRRPMRRVLEPLTRMGARAESTDGHAPLTIHGARLHAIAHVPQVPSAQIKSAVLLAGLLAEGVTSVTEPSPTRDHTERALEAFGGRVDRAGGTILVAGEQRLTPLAASVPGDFSSAAFWLVAAAAFPGSRVEIEDVGLNPSRTALLEILREYGAHVSVFVTGADAGEPRGSIAIEGDGARPVDIDPSQVPALIDELPAIAALAAGGADVQVRGAAELRVKESDRIAVLVTGLRRLGFDADERPDGFVVRGRSADGRALSDCAADACGDHRMAMSFAVAALAGRQRATIEGADTVDISYPGFFDTLNRLIA